MVAGLLWSVATWMKWAPVVFLPILAPRARLWGLVFLAASALLSLATLPLTILQLQALFGFGARPLRLDYLVFLWALVPYLWRKPEPFDFLHVVVVAHEARRAAAAATPGGAAARPGVLRAEPFDLSYAAVPASGSGSDGALGGEGGVEPARPRRGSTTGRSVSPATT